MRFSLPLHMWLQYTSVSCCSGQYMSRHGLKQHQHYEMSMMNVQHIQYMWSMIGENFSVRVHWNILGFVLVTKHYAVSLKIFQFFQLGLLGSSVLQHEINYTLLIMAA